MKNFSLELPTRTEFGNGVISKAGEEASAFGKRALLVYGKESLKRNGVYGTITSSLKENGIEWKEHAGVSPNPLLSHAYKGVEAAKEFGADLIIAAGGGSVIDESKTIALGYYSDSEEDLWKLFTREKAADKGLPIIAVQTMPATGSEMNLAAVITNDSTREKFSTRSVYAAPKVSLLDPSVTVKIPLRQTAFGCVDIISHLTEGFFSHKDSFAPVQGGICAGTCICSEKKHGYTFR